MPGERVSMPHRLIRHQIEARITERTIELFCKGERVAVHMRGAGRGRHTTIAEHMPSSHRRYAEWTIERIGVDATAIGPSTGPLLRLDPIDPQARPRSAPAPASRAGRAAARPP